MAPRRLEVDLVKTAGIVAVVLIHSLRPFFSPEASRGELRLTYALQFAVPGFLAASGLLHATAQRVPLAVTRGRLRRLLVPYLLASLAAQLFWSAFDGRTPSARVALQEILFAASFGPFYYIQHAVLFVLVAPLLARLRSILLAPAVLLAIVLQWLSRASWFGIETAEFLARWPGWALPSLPMFWAARNPLAWAGFYFAGWWLGARPHALPRWIASHRLKVGGASAVAAVAALLAASTAADRSPDAAASTLAVWCILLALLAIGTGRESRGRAVRFLSDSTYTIYLFHLFFVLPVQRLVPAAPGVFDPLAIGAAWIAGLAGPLAIAALGRALLGGRSRTFLGS